MDNNIENIIKSKIADCISIIKKESLSPDKADNISQTLQEQAKALDGLYRNLIAQRQMNELFCLNRALRPVVKELNTYARKNNEWAYIAGLLNGLFLAYSGITPILNNEQIFNIRMAECIKEPYTIEILNYLYSKENVSFISESLICSELGIEKSEFKKAVSPLIDVDCVEKHYGLQYASYTLSTIGIKYLRENDFFHDYSNKDIDFCTIE